MSRRSRREPNRSNAASRGCRRGRSGAWPSSLDQGARRVFWLMAMTDRPTTRATVRPEVTMIRPVRKVQPLTSQGWWTGGFGGSVVSAATKGGIVSMRRGLARTYGPSGITVNSIAPGQLVPGCCSDGLDPQGADHDDRGDAARADRPSRPSSPASQSSPPATTPRSSPARPSTPPAASSFTDPARSRGAV